MAHIMLPDISRARGDSDKSAKLCQFWLQTFDYTLVKILHSKSYFAKYIKLAKLAKLLRPA